MLKARLLIASCLASALVAVPLGGPVAAQEEPQFDCFIFLDEILFVPDGWTVWDLVETGGDTWRIRGDIALRVVSELTTSWTEATTRYVTCARAYAEAVAAHSVAGARADVESFLACMTEATAPLLESTPVTSRYVEAGLDGIVEIHIQDLLDDWNAVSTCALGLV